MCEFREFDFINDLFLDMIDDNKCIIREFDNIREYIFIGLDSDQNYKKMISVLSDWNIRNFYESPTTNINVIAIYSKKIDDFFINTFTGCDYIPNKHFFQYIKDGEIFANYHKGSFFIIHSKIWYEIEMMVTPYTSSRNMKNLATTNLIKKLLSSHLGIENHYIGHTLF
jgi:hypothetical protein